MTSLSVMAPTEPLDDLELDLVGRQALEGLREGLHRAWTSAFRTSRSSLTSPASMRRGGLRESPRRRATRVRSRSRAWSRSGAPCARRRPRPACPRPTARPRGRGPPRDRRGPPTAPSCRRRPAARGRGGVRADDHHAPSRRVPLWISAVATAPAADRDGSPRSRPWRRGSGSPSARALRPGVRHLEQLVDAGGRLAEVR